MTGNAWLRAGVAAAVLTMPASAWATHVRPGLWEVTSHVSMHNMEAMIPPEQLARMKAMGMHLPTDNTSTFRHCVSAADAANDTPPPMKDRDCSMSNVVYNAHTFSADLVCKKEREGMGQGHVLVTFDGDTHYSGQTSFSASANGRSMDMGSSFEGRWISADCGSEK